MNYRIRNACPGVTTPMATGDGFLLRLRQPLNGLTAEDLRVIATTAANCGSGVLELTMRAGLQLRGLPAERLDEAETALVAAGLAESDPAREQRRNLVIAPLTDRDPTATADTRPLARTVAAALMDDPALSALPPKVGVTIDGGGIAPIGGVVADVRLEAVTPARYHLAVGGTADAARVLGAVEEASAPEAVRRLLHCFLRLRGEAADPPARFAHALAEDGPRPFREAVADLLAPTTGALPEGAPTSSGDAAHILGEQPGWLGAAFPLGLLDAERLHQLADLMAPAGTLRLTPWRSVALTHPVAGAAARLVALGAVTSAGDPRLNAGACPGRDGCDVGTTATRADALAAVAAAPSLIAAGARFHVSGCGKLCGAPADASLTLSASEGRYDLHRGTAAGPLLAARLDPAALPPALGALDAAFTALRNPASDPDTALANLSVEELQQRIREAVSP